MYLLLIAVIATLVVGFCVYVFIVIPLLGLRRERNLRQMRATLNQAIEAYQNEYENLGREVQTYQRQYEQLTQTVEAYHQQHAQLDQQIQSYQRQYVSRLKDNQLKR